MEKITILDKTFRPYIPYEEMLELIRKQAEKINRDFADEKEPPVLLCILNGAMFFTVELMKHLNFNFELSSIKIKSYLGVENTGTIQLVTPLSIPVKGKTVIICEDIVDTGTTIQFVSDYLMKEGAEKIKIATMLLKPEVYNKPEKPDYIAKEIPNEFILGMGLDYLEFGRQIMGIYVLDK